jgi:enterochelin esterase-like enzyme
VPNAGERRAWEYVGDGLDAHVDRLVRLVDGAAAPVGLGGSSFGAYSSLYAWTFHPATFTRVLAMSTALWVRGDRLLEALERVQPADGTRIWLDVGGRESPRAQDAYRELRALLESKGVETDGYVDPDGDHTEAAWAKRLPDALRFLFA